MKLAYPLLVVALTVLSACVAEGMHPNSHFANGTVPYHQKVVSFDGQTALVTATKVAQRPDAASARPASTRHDVEVISRHLSYAIPSGDIELAKGFVARACLDIAAAAMETVTPVMAPGGYYRFEGLACTLTR